VIPREGDDGILSATLLGGVRGEDHLLVGYLEETARDDSSAHGQLGGQQHVVCERDTKRKKYEEHTVEKDREIHADSGWRDTENVTNRQDLDRETKSADTLAELTIKTSRKLLGRLIVSISDPQSGVVSSFGVVVGGNDHHQEVPPQGASGVSVREPALGSHVKDVTLVCLRAGDVMSVNHFTSVHLREGRGEILVSVRSDLQNIY
jgi:hypothetical protein